jgi:hypothetical protein
VAQSAQTSPVEEIFPAIGFPDGAIIRTGLVRGPHSGWGRSHIEFERGWKGTPTYDNTKATLADPDSGYPRADGTSQKYMKEGWVVIVEPGKVDPADGKMMGIITSRPAKPGEV